MHGACAWQHSSQRVPPFTHPDTFAASYSLGGALPGLKGWCVDPMDCQLPTFDIWEEPCGIRGPIIFPSEGSEVRSMDPDGATRLRSGRE